MSLQNPGDVSSRDVLEVSAVVEPSAAVQSGPIAERGCWLAVLPFVSRSALVVVVGGYADLHTAPDLRAQLLSTLVHRRNALVLDVQDLEFCDLHGLDALDDVVEAAESVGTSVTFRGASAQLSWLQAAFGRFSSSRPRSSPPPTTTPGRGRAGGCGAQQG